MWIQLIISLVLGLLPEVAFLTLFLIYTKNLKTKRIYLAIFISVIYLICMFIDKYKLYYYILFLVLIYIALKILYREKIQIIDSFVIGLGYSYICILASISLMLFTDDLSNYGILYIISRILLFLPFIFRKKFNELYEKYVTFWNRNDEIKKPIKSITLRIISLIGINLLVYIVDLALIKIATII